MKNLPSEVDESSLDIFVLSTRETVIPTEHLEREGYRVTLFADTTRLLATLRTGKPNLLICDSTTLNKEAYEVCRQIKEDDDLWVIPVLILTNASLLSDIFPVLDCNADNFIPLPFDLPLSLSVIESLLRTPVERQNPDQTQFGIRHDDRIYGVAASRRKLLELLLSSFEIAVNKSSELSMVKTEFQALSESAKYLEDRVAEQTRLIDTIKATLHQKEQKISILTGEVEEKKRLLAQKTRKAVIVTYDDNPGPIFQEKTDIGTSSSSEIATLLQQISELSHEIVTARTSLDSVQEELEEEKIHCTSLECTLELLVQQKELVEKTLHSLSGEHEKLLAAFEAEKTRVTAAEQELKTVIPAKTHPDQELPLEITEFDTMKNQQAADLNRLKSELEMEINRRISAENQLESLRQDKERSESLLRSSAAALKDQLDDLKVQLDTSRTAFATERNRVTAAEQELKTVIPAKTHPDQELTILINDFNTTKDQQAADLNRLKSELEMEINRRISAENQLESLRQDKERSESLLQSSEAALKDQLDVLRVQLDTSRSALADEENTTKVLRENLAEITAEYERTRIREKEERESLRQDKERSESLLQSSEAALKDQLDVLRVQLDTSRSALADEENTTKVLRENLAEIAAEHERTRIREKEERESDKATLLQQKRDLDEATAMVKTLEKNLNAVKIQNRTLVDELNLANQRKSQSDQQVRMLAEDLKKVRTALDAERSRHHANEKSIESLKQIIQRTEQDLRTSVEERNTLNQLLENERKVRALPEETSKSVIEEQKPPGEELRARAEHQARARMQVSSREETAETEEEKGKENIGKDAEIFVTSGSPAQAPVIPATPDAQKSAFSAHGPASFKPAFQITEVSHEAVTDIIDIFSDDESIEDNNLL